MASPKRVSDYRRRRASKSPRLRILIVSEGEKTEGIYFSVLVRNLQSSNVRVDILGKECGSDPQTVVEYAAARFKADSGYDLCYCVIDRDSHPVQRFNAALLIGENIQAKYKNREFRVILSDPCIEYWFLLHFIYMRSPFERQGTKSRADCAIEKLKQYLPLYQKAERLQIASLLPETEKAIDHAKRALADARVTGDSNPSTLVHEVVERVKREAKS